MPHANPAIPVPTRRGDPPPTLPPQSRRAATSQKRESRGVAAGRREPLHLHDLALHGELCKDLRRRESIAHCAGMFAPTRRMRRLHSLVPGAGPVAHLPAYPPCVDVVSNTDTSASALRVAAQPQATHHDHSQTPAHCICHYSRRLDTTGSEANRSRSLPRSGSLAVTPSQPYESLRRTPYGRPWQLPPCPRRITTFALQPHPSPRSPASPGTPSRLPPRSASRRGS